MAVTEEQKNWVELLKTHAERIGILAGFKDLQALHGEWIRKMLFCKDMYVLKAHRSSYKTSCLEIVIALFIVLKPNCSIFFVRKTDDDVKEVVEKVQHLLKKDVFRVLTKVMHGVDLVLEKETAFAIDTNLNQHKEMVTAQLLGFGLKGSMTGKHCDILILDDICFVAGTKIATPFGDKNIEDLRVGDLVLTSTGYERVVKTTNRIADVITNVGLCGTPNHPVYSKVTRDYKPLAEVIKEECSLLTLKEVLEWQTKLLQGQKEALKISVNETNETVKAFYINNAEVVQNQLDLLNRLIEQAKVA